MAEEENINLSTLTKAVGENNGGLLPPGSTITTMAVGEESGGAYNPPNTINNLLIFFIICIVSFFLFFLFNIYYGK